MSCRMSTNLSTHAFSASWGNRGRFRLPRIWSGLALMILAVTALRADDVSPLLRAPAMPDIVTAEADGSPSTAERTQLRLIARYSNPVNVRLLRSLSKDQGLRWFSEASRLIDERHLKPASYQARVIQAATNLWYGIENAAFLEANGLRPSGQQVEAFRRALRELIRSRPVKDLRDALNMLQWIADLGDQHLRLPTAAVAMEFVYGSSESLDKYSTFVPEDVAGKPSATLEDHIVGIGVEVKLHERGVLIEKVISGTPAAEAGLKTGDLIVSVNGRELAGKGLDHAVDLITGPAGSPVTLGFSRDGGAPVKVTMTRRRVPVYTVTDVQMIDPQAKVGYLKLTRFAQASSEEMDKALWQLHRQGMQSLVIDLRGNPGGLLTTAVDISNKFLPAGTIVSTRGRLVTDSSLEKATYERTWKVPLVVLIDGESASASEIFAAAIQENHRGVIVGRRSFGKGTVQTHFPLRSVTGSLKLTTAHFYAPSGRVMAEAGVEPDVVVPLAAAASQQGWENDADIRQALAVARSGRPAELAAYNPSGSIGANTEWRLKN